MTKKSKIIDLRWFERKKKEEEEEEETSIPFTNEMLTRNYSFQVYKIYIATFCFKKPLLSILLRIFLFWRWLFLGL